MNREIKFRGLCTTSKLWVYGYFSKDYIGLAYITSLDGTETSVVDVDTIGQFTGMKDQHDVEIYEGDIVETVQNSLHNRLIEPVISFEEGCFVVIDSKYSYEYLHYYETDTQIEVISNIHQLLTDG